MSKLMVLEATYESLLLVLEATHECIIGSDGSHIQVNYRFQMSRMSKLMVLEATHEFIIGTGGHA